MSEPTTDLEAKFQPEAVSLRKLRDLVRHMKLRSKDPDSRWMDIDSPANSDWYQGRLPPKYLEEHTHHKYKSYKKELDHLSTQKPIDFSSIKASSRGKLMMRVITFWWMRESTRDEARAVKSVDERKWYSLIRLQWRSGKKETLMRCIALVLQGPSSHFTPSHMLTPNSSHLISKQSFETINRADHDARLHFWEKEITVGMMIWVFNFWRDAIDFRWIFATSPSFISKYREPGVSEQEQELASHMDRQVRNRLIGWLDTVYLYAVDTVASENTEWPIQCDAVLCKDLELYGTINCSSGFHWSRRMDELPCGNGKYTRNMNPKQYLYSSDTLGNEDKEE